MVQTATETTTATATAGVGEEGLVLATAREDGTTTTTDQTEAELGRTLGPGRKQEQEGKKDRMEQKTTRKGNGMVRTDDDDIVWGTGTLPEPIRNQKRERD